jgi:ABC-type Fe3+-siderophore transport system permease subunit
MFAHQSLAIDIPTGFLGIFIGLSFGFVIGLFYYQAYRKPYYWFYSIFSSVAAASIMPFILHGLLKMDPSTLHAIMAQFAAAMVASVLANHLLYLLKKRHKMRLKSSRHRRRYAHSMDLGSGSATIRHIVSTGVEPPGGLVHARQAILH